MSEPTFDRKSCIGHALFTGFIKEGGLYRRFEEDHVQRGYPVETLDRLLAQAGFAFRSVDGHRLSRPRKASPRLLYICRHRTERGRAHGARVGC